MAFNKLTRRGWLGTVAAAAGAGAQDRIDRRAVVSRHNPVMRALDRLAPLSVGNGEFAFTADVTGLQTFAEEYEAGIPLCTQSNWGWHSFPGAFRADDLKLRLYETYGRKVGYPASSQGQRELFNWLRENPHRLNLGRVGFVLRKKDGTAAGAAEITDVEQTLELWSGTLMSRFRVEGERVDVRTCCDPELDLIAVEVESALLRRGALAVFFAFPYGSADVDASDWKRVEAHSTTLAHPSAQRADLSRKLDAAEYVVRVGWSGKAEMRQEAPHRFVLEPGREAERFSFVCHFAKNATPSALPRAGAVLERSAKHWAQFWSTGGAVDFDGSRDERARELERRVVLSQYLTALQCAGSLPPQETGLTCNSWYGKFHLEMHWWHAAHFALWNRTPMLERSLPYYSAILASARHWAQQQGYRGARWPKMTDPSGRDSPSPIGPLLIWQQPHPIHYAELCYRAHPNRATAERYRDVVFETAQFMAAYAHYDAARDRYVLGPPVIPAQENHAPETTWNPTFELEYWHWALGVAQQWRERLGLAREPEWDRVRAKLSKLPVLDGVYLAHENCPETFTKKNTDHPSMLAALGVLPGALADCATMRRTLKKVMKTWQWPTTWGWDYPVVAMAAARLGERRAAVDALLLDTPKNRWLPNGHNFQRDNLKLYLPGNGGLLAAIAMMCAGWENGPRAQTPGFPDDGSWRVRWEGLKPIL